MEYMDLIRAREGLSILQTAKFPISQLKTMRTIYRMNNEIADAMRFLADEERKIIAKYGGEVNDEGKIVFPQGDDPTDKAAQISDELEQLHESEVEWKFDKIEIPYSVLAGCGISLSPADLASIEVLITIVEDEKESEV